MSLKKVFFLTVVCALFTLIPAATAQDDPGFSINVVVAMTGPARIHRVEWVDINAYEVLALGDFVGNADIIEPEFGVRILVQCADGQIVEIVNDAASPSECDPLPTLNLASALARGAETEHVQLIYPLGTIAADRPQIRWRGIDGVTRYTVWIMQGDTGVWEEPYRVESTQFDYPEDEDALSPGSYVIRVEPLRSNNRPLENREANASVIIDLDRFNLIDIAVSTRDFLDTQAGMRDYVRALMLANAGYYWDAITTLQRVLGVDAESGAMFADALPDDPLLLPGSPAPYLRLGEWYAEMRLIDFAAVAYDTALRLARLHNQRENEAAAILALSGLGADRVMGAEPRMMQGAGSGSEYYCNLRRAAEFFALFGEDSELVGMLRGLMHDIEQEGGAAYEC
jgi:hypothetical protein